MRTLLAVSLLSLPVLSTAASATPLRNQVSTYEVQVMQDGNSVAPTYQHRGESFVLGQRGQRYTVRVHNHSARRVEAVVSVDGRDVVDGRTADYRQKRGYLVPPWGYVDVEGWRISQGEAAAFRFSSVANSYVGRTGSTREVGVIGVAIFPEQYYAPPRPYHLPRTERFYQPSEDQSDYDLPSRKSESSAPAPSAVAPHGETRAHGGGALVEREAFQRDKRPGLGTGFGERLTSPVEEVVFIRQNPTAPAVVMGLRYNDRTGLLAMGVDVDGDGGNFHDTYLRRTAEPFAVPDRRYAPPPVGWEP